MASNQPTDRIKLPSDPRVQHRYTYLNGIRYHYLYAEPQNGVYRATVFLIHGWPDISAGWRFQIPLFLEMGCRVVCPDLMGFGETEAPPVPPNDLKLYSMKRISDDIRELAKQLDAKRIILGGHDWGGSIVWRAVFWDSDLISHVFSVCTAYSAPQRTYQSTEDLVKGRIPQFGYQIQLASGEVEKHIKSKEDIRQFLNGMYGGRGPNGQLIFSTFTGIQFENVPLIRNSPLLSHEELEYYTDQYSRNGLHGGLNWYRTRKINFEDDLELESKQIEIPALFIGAKKDQTLKPEMAARMDKHFKNLTKREVFAGHWALWETPKAVNDTIREWFDSHVFVQKASL